MKGELNRTVMIYVDSYDDGIPTGSFHLASDAQAQPFGSLSQLLLKINDSMDRENFPQAFSELRKFQRPVARLVASTDGPGQKKGQMATFILRILFRQNASWQGSVTWVEGNQEEYFRSVLELIALMDNALNYKEEA